MSSDSDKRSITDEQSASPSKKRRKVGENDSTEMEVENADNSAKETLDEIKSNANGHTSNFKLPQISEEYITHYCTKTSLGVANQLESKVRGAIMYKNLLKANIDGITAKVTFFKNQVRKTICPCEFRGILWCPHVIALLLSMIRRPTSVLFYEKLKDQIENTDIKRLQSVLLYLLTTNIDLLPSYDDAYNRKVTDGPPEESPELLSESDPEDAITGPVLNVDSFEQILKDAYNSWLSTEVKSDKECPCSCHVPPGYYGGKREQGWVKGNVTGCCSDYHDRSYFEEVVKLMSTLMQHVGIFVECKDFANALGILVRITKFSFQLNYRQIDENKLKPATKKYFEKSIREVYNQLSDIWIDIFLRDLPEFLKQKYLTELKQLVPSELMRLFDGAIKAGEHGWTSELFKKILKGDPEAVKNFKESGKLCEIRVAVLVNSERYEQCLRYVEAVGGFFALRARLNAQLGKVEEGLNLAIQHYTSLVECYELTTVVKPEKYPAEAYKLLMHGLTKLKKPEGIQSSIRLSYMLRLCDAAAATNEVNQSFIDMLLKEIQYFDRSEKITIAKKVASFERLQDAINIGFNALSAPAAVSQGKLPQEETENILWLCKLVLTHQDRDMIESCVSLIVKEYVRQRDLMSAITKEFMEAKQYLFALTLARYTLLMEKPMGTFETCKLAWDISRKLMEQESSKLSHLGMELIERDIRDSAQSASVLYNLSKAIYEEGGEKQFLFEAFLLSFDAYSRECEIPELEEPKLLKYPEFPRHPGIPSEIQAELDAFMADANQERLSLGMFNQSVRNTILDISISDTLKNYLAYEPRSPLTGAPALKKLNFEQPAEFAKRRETWSKMHIEKTKWNASVARRFFELIVEILEIPAQAAKFKEFISKLSQTPAGHYMALFDIACLIEDTLDKKICFTVNEISFRRWTSDKLPLTNTATQLCETLIKLGEELDTKAESEKQNEKSEETSAMEIDKQPIKEAGQYMKRVSELLHNELHDSDCGFSLAQMLATKGYHKEASSLAEQCLAMQQGSADPFEVAKVIVSSSKALGDVEKACVHAGVFFGVARTPEAWQLVKESFESTPDSWDKYGDEVLPTLKQLAIEGNNQYALKALLEHGKPADVIDLVQQKPTIDFIATFLDAAPAGSKTIDHVAPYILGVAEKIYTGWPSVKYAIFPSGAFDTSLTEMSNKFPQLAAQIACVRADKWRTSFDNRDHKEFLGFLQVLVDLFKKADMIPEWNYYLEGLCKSLESSSASRKLVVMIRSEKSLYPTAPANATLRLNLLPPFGQHIVSSSTPPTPAKSTTPPPTSNTNSAVSSLPPTHTITAPSLPLAKPTTPPSVSTPPATTTTTPTVGMATGKPAIDSVTFQCPMCGAPLCCPSTLLKLKVVCPRCSTVLTVRER